MANALALLLADTVWSGDQGLIAIQHPFWYVRRPTEDNAFNGIIELRLEVLLCELAKFMEVPKGG
jgi:hypothetical protein